MEKDYRKSFFLIAAFLSFNIIGCGSMYYTDDDYYEDYYWADDASDEETEDLNGIIADLQDKLDTQETRIERLSDNLWDIEYDVRGVEEDLEDIRTEVGDNLSENDFSADNAKDLRNQVIILKNDVRWLKNISKK